MPSKVRAFCHNGKWHDIEVEDDVTAYLEFPNGATGVFVTTTADAPGTNRLEVTLEKGKLVAEKDELKFYELEINEREYCYQATEGFAKPPCHETTLELDGKNPQHIGVLNAFAAAILRGEPLVADGVEGIHGLELSNAMHLSSWLEKPVSLPIIPGPVKSFRKLSVNTFFAVKMRLHHSLHPILRKHYSTHMTTEICQLF